MEQQRRASGAKRAGVIGVAFAIGCTPYGPPPTADVPPPRECQQIIDQCSGPADGAGGVSAADDCVRIARDMTTTAAHCVEIAAMCATVCTGGAAGDATAGE